MNEDQCFQCGVQLRTQRENVPFRALPGATLLGVPVHRCPECGEYEVESPRIEDLHRALASIVIRKTGRLAGDEIRFLRKCLGWSGADFAKAIGATAETVSRWEAGKQQMGPQADRLLRLLVVCTQPVQDYSVDVLSNICGGPATVERRSIQFDGERWEPQVAA